MSSNRRLNRIFRPSGRALIVALDHGLLDGPCPGLEHPAKTLAQIAAGGADAVLTSYGLARRFARELAPLGLILRVDGGATSLGPAGGPPSLLYRVEDALRLGADAIALNGFPGAPHEQASLENIARAVGLAHPWGLPVMAEMVPGGFDSPPEWRSVENIALAVRVAAEMGADFVKTPYAADFERVTRALLRAGRHPGRGQTGQRAGHAGRHQIGGRRRGSGRGHRPQHLPGRRSGGDDGRRGGHPAPGRDRRPGCRHSGISVTDSGRRVKKYWKQKASVKTGLTESPYLC